MSAPASEDLRELERLLVVAGESGDTMTEAVLADELGAGHDDLRTMLSTLREHGKAVEESPGEWRDGTGNVSELPTAGNEPVKVHVPDAAAPSLELEDGYVQPPIQQFLPSVQTWGPPPHVRLTRAICAAIEPAALGALIKAGIDDTEDDETFRLEVAP